MGPTPAPLIPASALAGSQHDLSAVHWSPDGTMVAGSRRADGRGCCRSVRVERGWHRHPAANRRVGRRVRDRFAWSPDSTRIAFEPVVPGSGDRDDDRPTHRRGLHRRRSRHRHRADAGFRRRPLQLVAPTGPPCSRYPGNCLTHHRERRPVRPLAIDVATGNADQVDWGSGRGSLLAARRALIDLRRPTARAGKEEPRVVGPGVQGEGVGCGERIRTSDLRVMSPTSCRCSTPRLLTVRPAGRFGQTRRRARGRLGSASRLAGSIAPAADEQPDHQAGPSGRRRRRTSGRRCWSRPARRRCSEATMNPTVPAAPKCPAPWTTARAASSRRPPRTGRG